MHKQILALLRCLLNLLYNPLAWAYDGVAWLVSLGRWQAWGRLSVRHLQGPLVLDLGHGPGHLLVSLARGGFQPIGVDLSRHQGRLAKRKSASACVSVPLVNATAVRLPIQDARFNSVVSTFPAEFILYPETILEAARVLVPGGRFVVALGVEPTVPGLLARLVRWLHRVVEGVEQPTAGICRLMVQAGFSVHQHWEETPDYRLCLLIGEKPA